MRNKQKTKFILSNNINMKKKSTSPENKIEQINFKTQTPLFRIFMDNNKIKKIHLTRNTINYSREETIKKMKKTHNNNNNIFFNLRIISFKILDAQYNMTPELYQQKIIFNLVRNKKGHLLSHYHEILLFENSLIEFLKKSYKYKECMNKIPKYYNYYKNYLKYFCHPIFVDFTINKKMVKHMEKNAQVFYNKNYITNVNNNENKELNFIIFNKRVIKDIEKVSIFTDGYTSSKKKDNKDNKDNNNDNQLFAKNNKNQNHTNVDVTPITTLTYGINCPQVTKNSKYNNNDNIQNEDNSILLNTEYNIINSNAGNNTKISETNSSLKTLLNELKENKNNNKNNFIISEEETLKRFMESPDISPAQKINSGLISPKNINLKKSKKLGFKSNSNKLFLTSKYENLKKSIGNENNNKNLNINNNNNIKVINNNKDEKIISDNQINKIENPILNKKMIKNLNININQLIINNKIIASDNGKNLEYNKLLYKKKMKNENNNNNNNNIINEIKNIFKGDNKNKNKNNNKIQSCNNDKKIKNKKIIDFKTTIHIGNSNSNSIKLYHKLNRVNSMSKITPLSINSKKERRYNSNIRERKYERTNSLMKFGGNILESQGKLTLSSKNSIIKKKKIITSDNNSNIFTNFNFTKINLRKRENIKSNNNNGSIRDNKYNYIINSDKDSDNRRSASNSKRTHIKIFKSGFNFNLSNDKSNINSGVNSPSNSIHNNKNTKVNNLKYNLHLKDISNKGVQLLACKKFGQKFFGRKKMNEDTKLKLKNFDCIRNENIRNFNVFSPKKNAFRKGPISLKLK